MQFVACTSFSYSLWADSQTSQVKTELKFVINLAFFSEKTPKKSNQCWDVDAFLLQYLYVLTS